VALNENRIAWTVLAVSATAAEADWRDRAIRDIADRTGGRLADVSSEHAEVLARNAITSCYSPRCCRMAPRQLTTSFGVYDSFNLLPQVIETGERLMRPYKEERKTVAEGGPEEFWIWPTEGRHLWTENIVNTDNDSARSAGDGYSFVLETFDENDRHPLGMAAFALGGQIAELYGTQFGLNTWMAKVKRTFDPHGAADGIYPTGARPLSARMWPLLRKILFRFPALLRASMAAQIRNNRSGSRIQ
jgi:glycolate oxidase